MSERAAGEGTAGPPRKQARSGAVNDAMPVIDAFLDGAAVLASALGSPEVTRRWDEPSVLDGQTIGGLAGHLARGGVWLVAEYLASGEPDGPLTFDSAGAYFAAFVENATPASHEAIRGRGAEVASLGPAATSSDLAERLSAIRRDLPSISEDRRVAVVGGAVMRLGDYLRTRIVEQTVHLDDLGRSVGHQWEPPEACVRITIEVGLEVARRLHGDEAVLRGLYRQGFGEVFPVL